ncbi:protein sel-1 homolog 3 isoform X2 [Denticeps clupeoides]|nr:protein sel-1 homolog 3 isoform X2 [Denticeps clupeoides]
MNGLKWRSCLLPTLMRLSVFITITECLSTRSQDDVRFLNPPEEVQPSYSLQVLYACSDMATVHVEALVTFDTGETVAVFGRRWHCEAGLPKVRTLGLKLPDWLVYQPDWKIPDSDWALSGMLRAWVGQNGYLSAAAHAVTLLNVRGPFSRPPKQHRLCLSWGMEIVWRTHRSTILQCPKEQEVAVFLPLLYASTGERFGITRVLHPFRNKNLERWRFRAVSYPWCAFSMWIFQAHPCRQRLCGILHHIDTENNYATPSIFLKDTGHLHVQFHGKAGTSSAFLSQSTVPLHQWCRIRLEVDGRVANLTVVCLDGQQPLVYTMEHRFNIAVTLDDTTGYFVIGGGEFVHGIEGYYGPVTYYRNRKLSETEKEVYIEPPVKMLQQWLQTCHEFKSDVKTKIAGCSERVKSKRPPDTCMDVYSKWAEHSLPTIPQSEPWEAPRGPQRRYAERLTEILTSKYGATDPSTISRALYSLSLRKMSQDGESCVARRVIPLLLQAGCLGNNDALHLSSVLYSSGFGVKRDPRKAWLLALLAAQQDWRLALLRLGYLHHVGEQNISPDPDLAYAYYSNIAKQTSQDRQNVTSKQTYVEEVYLNNDEVLKTQTNENDDLFHWLKLQARNGVAGAEQAMGRMLFWGQKGVSTDIQTAVKHYERGATRLEDPVSMYDFAIVLLMGRGVKQDIPRAVFYLKKAVAQGFGPAMNALAWYYERYEKDYEQAVQLWEQADALGSSDAAMNLGVMYSQGLYPGQSADQVRAYRYFLKSAERRHVDGAIHLAQVWVRGLPGHVKRMPLNAVLWVKWASEQNGYLGKVLRKGLDAYFKEDWLTALVYYMIAAESGFAAAQFNVAYLCELNPGGFLTPTFVKQCMWRYYNLTIQSQYPDSHAFIKMGDLLCGYDGLNFKDVQRAAEMYKRAALHGNPQGWYSLGALIQAGETLPVPVLLQLDLLKPYLSSEHELLTALYRRCRDSNSTDAYLPCTLALLSAHLHPKGTADVVFKISSTVAVALVTILFFIRRHTVFPGQTT